MLTISFALFSLFYRSLGIPSGGSSAVASDGPAPEKDFSRSRRVPAAKTGRTGKATDNNNNNSEENQRKRKTSLRITSGRRGSELTQRRGSLRKRDRSREREAKLEAALERRTVYLPEYVACSGIKRFLCRALHFAHSHHHHPSFSLLQWLIDGEPIGGDY